MVTLEKKSKELKIFCAPAPGVMDVPEQEGGGYDEGN